MAWKKPEAERLQLPSGNEAMVKKPDIMGLVMHNAGVIPDFLTGRLTARLTGKGKPGTNATGDIQAEDWPKIATFIDLAVCAALVNPIIVTENPDYDAEQMRVLIGDISADDKMVIFGWAMSDYELLAVESFRGQDGVGGDLQFAPDGGGLRRQTVRDVSVE